MLLVVAVTTGVLDIGSRGSAIQQRHVAIARKAAADAAEVRQQNSALAAQLNLAAHWLADTRDVRDRLMSAFATPYTSRITGHTSDVVSLSFAPKDAALATESWDRTVGRGDVRAPIAPYSSPC
ncbi:hypothetical protein AB0451_40375 [Streptomyces sp. NPDC052000]|uniref:hypothetical protein n=1 Tax=Streptomyces sp. NPDC052000 TaxID=3155676 RepID=UPI00344F272A